ncbi:hypothetical protein K491DRAFT_608576, partial [Lophiostoma macrostomum CBS 122681]
LPTMSSSISPTLLPPKTPSETPATEILIQSLGLQKHIEGGYFAEIDRNPLIISNPFLAPTSHNLLPTPPNETTTSKAEEELEEGRTANDAIRNASTSIFYMLTPTNPMGHFHRNKGRTVHTLISGRGRYVLIHADEPGEVKRVETFAVGHDVAKGEKCVWVVEGGKYKASFVTKAKRGDGEEEGEGERLLISETVVPGFEYSDHDFLTRGRFEELLGVEERRELGWLVRRGETPGEGELL